MRAQLDVTISGFGQGQGIRKDVPARVRLMQYTRKASSQ
jgi:hypothetical protein